MSAKPTLLVIEDSDAQRRACELMFGNHFTLHLAADGKTGLAMLQKAPIDAVLLDYNLPDLKGKELIQSVRKVSPHVKILVNTGEIGMRDPQELIEEGADAVIEKGIDNWAETVTETLQKLLSFSK